MRPQQQCDPVAGLDQADLEVGYAGPCLLAVGARLLDVAAGCESGLVAPFGDLQRLGLADEVVAGDADAVAQGLSVNIVLRHFSDERDPRIVEAGPACSEVGAGGLDAAPRAAEKVDFPTRIEAGVIAVAAGAGAGGRQRHRQHGCDCPEAGGEYRSQFQQGRKWFDGFYPGYGYLR